MTRFVRCQLLFIALMVLGVSTCPVFAQMVGLLDTRTRAYVGFASPSYTLSAEGTSVAVMRTGEYREPASVDYAADDGSVRGTLLIPAGVGFVTLALPVRPANASVRLTLSNPGPNVVITRREATIMLVGEAAAPEPTLTLRPNGRGEVILSWPAQSSGYVLEKSDNPAGGVWTFVPAAPELSEGTYRVVEPISRGHIFYRIRVP